MKVFRDNELISEEQTPKVMVTLPLHGPEVTADEVLKMLLKEESDLKSCIIHIDIPIRVSALFHSSKRKLTTFQVLRSIDDIIFSLLILGGLTDSKGNVWRCHPSQLYVVELTLPLTKVLLTQFLSFINYLLVIHLEFCSD